MTEARFEFSDPILYDGTSCHGLAAAHLVMRKLKYSSSGLGLRVKHLS